MPDIYGSHFEFDGQSSRQFKLIIVNVETERLRSLSGAIEGSTVFDKKAKRRRLINTTYDNSPLSFEVDIVTDDATTIHNEQRRKIEKWLFNRNKYCKFYLDLADDRRCETFEYVNGQRKRLYLNCRFVNPEKLEYFNGIVGYRATMELDSGYWMQEAITYEFNLQNQPPDTQRVIVHVDSDIDDYIYPYTLIIMQSGGGDVSITNLTDDNMRRTEFTDILTSSSIIINSATNYVSGYFDNFSSPNFPRLVDGDNEILIGGNVDTVAFQFNNRRRF